MIETRLPGLLDATVVGTGPAGLAAALSLAHVGASVALIGPQPKPPREGPGDTRSAALLTSSVDLLERLGVWDAIAPQSAALKAIRIIDDSKSLVRAPEIEFAAAELGLDAFGYNIPNTVLSAALYSRAIELLPALHATTVENIELGASSAVLRCTDGTVLDARLVVGADGRKSVCREAASIAVSEWRYDQGAIATGFTHALPHRNISSEIHREAGSVTTVPLPDAHASSLIWVGSTAEIDDLMRADDEAFGNSLSQRLGGVLGAIGNVGPRAFFPVAGLSAKSLTGRRTALVGEAAHILPPIGAQGLNLGLRDAAALADCVKDALRQGADPGGDPVLGVYARARELDIMSRTVGVDLLNRSLLTDFKPLQAARGLVLHGLKALPLLRRVVMRVGLEPPTALPSLMRRAG